MKLAERKRLLIARADLHREMMRLEYLSIGQRWKSGLSVGGGNSRWWVLGSAAAGLLLTRPGRGMIRWVPTLLAIWRGFKR